MCSQNYKYYMIIIQHIQRVIIVAKDFSQVSFNYFIRVNTIQGFQVCYFFYQSLCDLHIYNFLNFLKMFNKLIYEFNIYFVST
jgi:hypothetical protein